MVLYAQDVTSDEITPEDIEKIDAIDWLGFDPSPAHRLELLVHANALARNFIRMFFLFIIIYVSNVCVRVGV